MAEINLTNVGALRRHWTYSLGSDAEGARGPNSQATPIVVGDVMYVPAADRVVALDPVSGAELWSHSVDGGVPSRRGVAYWRGDGELGPRVLFTSGSRLIAIDASSGAPATGFGSGGEIDMVVPYNSVPLVYENVVVVGANTPPGAPGGIGNARAYDARTGAKLWEFSSVPQPGSVGHDTWAGDSWEDRLGANAWPFYFTMDEERGLLYLPLAAPIPFWYGGDRPGANLFGNSVVAVDIRTGEYRWHFQTIHHDLWDHDPPAPPVLFDAPLAGGTVPALGLTTKSGYVYLLNRETGEPLFGVEERPVPASDVPGEVAYPTQPIPVKPPPASRVAYQPSDLVTEDDTSPEHVAACRDLIERVGDIYNAGPFTPWAYRGPGQAQRTTLLFPGLVGGHNWGGGAFDPRTGYVFVFSQDLGSLGWIEEATTGNPAVPYRRVGPRPGDFDVDMGDSRWPCQKPPWGRMTAIDAATGDIAWQVPLGVTDALPPGRRNTGRPGRAAAIVTGGGLVFVASTDDNRLRALEATSGRELWSTVLEARGNANPMTYGGADGRQYVAIVATDQIIAYRLP
jgi:quinoprotein glucose dehydrogenase